MADGAPEEDVSDALNRELERFCRDFVDARAIDAACRIPPSLLEGLAELGVFGLTLPSDVGGAGLGLWEACRAVEVLARVDRSVAVSVGLHLGLGTRGLVRFGTAAQLTKYGPELAAGARLAAFSTTEPGAGSDLTALRTTLRKDGDGLVLDGEKSYVTNGGFAGLFTVAAASPGLGGAPRGQSLVLVEKEDAGFLVEREEHKLGLKGSSTTGLRFEGVRLPAERLLGEPGQGAKALQHILSWGRTLMSAGCRGAAHAALEAAKTHVETRHQFGKPLGAQEVVQDRLERLATRAFAMDALVHATASASDEEHLARLSLATKVFCSEGAWLVADEAIQLHGALGFIEDTGLALVLRDVRVTRIFEGANDVLLTHLGASELTSPLPIGGASAGLERAYKDLLTEVLSTHKVRVFRMPRILHAVGTAAQVVFAARASLARARSLLDESARRFAVAVERDAFEAIADALSLTAVSPRAIPLGARLGVHA